MALLRIPENPNGLWAWLNRAICVSREPVLSPEASIFQSVTDLSWGDEILTEL